MPEPTEIKAYWRYGEVGQDYLDFRIKYPCEFPSIADGLSKIEELWHLISPGYMRIRPYIKIGEVNNTWKNWSQAIQYGYIPYANRKKDKNFKEFNEKYHAFLMQHGSQKDLNLNTFQNAVPKYWSDQLLHNEAGHISDYVKPIIANVELLLPLFMALFTFEDSLSDHTTDRKFLPATSSLPTNVESTWSIYKRNVMPLPMPELPIIKLYWNAKANFGSVSGGKSRDLNIVYSIPKLSLIVLANEKSITLLTPSGDQSVIYGVKCNAVWMQYLFVNDSQTLIFEKNVSHTFKNNQLLYSQVKTTLFFPIIKKMESARPNQTFVQVPLPLEIKENISQAYLIALNNKSIDRALQTLTGTPILHQEWEKNQTDYNSQENFKYGTWDRGVVRFNNKDDWKFEITQEDTTILTITALTVASFALGIANADLINAHDYRPLSVFLVSTFTGTMSLISQKIVLPIIQWYNTDPMAGAAVVLFDKFGSKIMSSNMQKYIVSETARQTSSFLITQFGKNAIACFNAASLNGWNTVQSYLVNYTPSTTPSTPETQPETPPETPPATPPATTTPFKIPSMPISGTTAAALASGLFNSSISAAGLALTGVGTLCTVAVTIYVLSGNQKKRKKN